MLLLGCWRRASLATASTCYPNECRPLCDTCSCHRRSSLLAPSNTVIALPQRLTLTSSSELSLSAVRMILEGVMSPAVKRFLFCRRFTGPVAIAA